MTQRFLLDGNDMEDYPAEENGDDFLYFINNHIYFYQEIERGSALLFNKIITEAYFSIIHQMINSGLSNPELHIHFNSPGGEMFSTLSMLRTVESIKKGLPPVNIPMKIVTHIDGESSSGASVISIAGNERFIGEYSCVLIHNAFSGVQGKPENLEDHIENTKMLVDKMKSVYQRYTKITTEQLDELLKHDLYLTSAKCIEYGICDHIE